MQLPKIGFIRQRYEGGALPDAYRMTRAELERTRLLEAVQPGQSVLITAGSRGIDAMREVLRSCISAVKDRGGKPFLFPSMGSHGRGNGPGQVEVLEHLGITESNMGVPVHSGMEMVEIDRILDSVPIYTDRAAVEADHILIVNRVKEHTEYIGDTESGILKMAVVGMGRQMGAETMHHLAVNISYVKAIHAIAAAMFKNLKVLGGIALLEDHTNQLRRLEAIPASEVFSREPELLEESKRYKAKLPFDLLDVLLVDEIGKEISGAGMDTKVIGRIMNIYEKECETPRITRIVVRDMSEKSGGNATGIGLADFITRKAFEKIDFEATFTNCVTASAPEKGRIPLTLPSDRAALEAAFRTIGLWTPEKVKLAWIPNTKSLEWLAVSPALLDAARNMPGIDVAADLIDLPFDASGNLPRLDGLLNQKG